VLPCDNTILQLVALQHYTLVLADTVYVYCCPQCIEALRDNCSVVVAEQAWLYNAALLIVVKQKSLSNCKQCRWSVCCAAEVRRTQVCSLCWMVLLPKQQLSTESSSWTQRASTGNAAQLTNCCTSSTHSLSPSMHSARVIM
jgi:hypothetical protein